MKTYHISVCCVYNSPLSPIQAPSFVRNTSLYLATSDAVDNSSFNSPLRCVTPNKKGSLNRIFPATHKQSLQAQVALQPHMSLYCVVLAIAPFGTPFCSILSYSIVRIASDLTHKQKPVKFSLISTNYKEEILRRVQRTPAQRFYNAAIKMTNKKAVTGLCSIIKLAGKEVTTERNKCSWRTFPHILKVLLTRFSFTAVFFNKSFSHFVMAFPKRLHIRCQLKAKLHLKKKNVYSQTTTTTNV